MLLTLKEVRESSLRNIAGSCPNSGVFTQLVNDATRRCMRRGDWPGTTVPIHVCVRQGCVVWPRYVGSVRRINVCKQPIQIKNQWYEFLQYQNSSWCGAGGSNAAWWGNNLFGSWCGASVHMLFQGKSPVFQDMLGEGRFVRAYYTANSDINKTVRIFGTDNNGQILRTANADGTYSDGWSISLLNPFGSTSGYVRHIDRVILDDMQGDVRLYGYNAETDLLEDIGTYEPGDTNPAFERYKLNLGQCQDQCGCTRSVVALVKLKFIPARYDNDLVLIDNMDALRLMCQSIKYEEAGDRKGAREYEMDAIRELNLGLNDDTPLEQIGINQNCFNGVPVGFQQQF